MHIDSKLLVTTLMSGTAMLIITAFFNMDSRVTALEVGDKEDKRVNELVYALPEQLNRIDSGVQDTGFKVSTMQMQLQYVTEGVERRLSLLENAKLLPSEGSGG